MRATVFTGDNAFVAVARVEVLNKGPKRSRVRLLSSAWLLTPLRKAVSWRYVKAGARTYVPTNCLRFNGK